MCSSLRFWVSLEVPLDIAMCMYVYDMTVGN